METPAAPVASTPATTSCADAPADRVERLEFREMPHPSQEAPKCIDCRHLKQCGPVVNCAHPQAPVSLVYGWPLVMPAQAREPKGHLGFVCGPEGRLFERVEPVTTSLILGPGVSFEVRA